MVPRPPEPLEVNALAIWPDAGSDPILLVTVDLLYPGPALRAAVERSADPLPPDRILLAASHTHRAPMTDATKLRLGLVDDSYLNWLENTVDDLVSEVLNQHDAVPVTLRAGSGLAGHSINRRRRRLVEIGRDRVRVNVTRLAPNPQGVTDESVILATLFDLSGRPVAHLWNYACHPVSHPDPYGYSSHYISVVREALRKRFDCSSTPVLFFQGFSGNTRPRASIGIPDRKDFVRGFLGGPSFQAKMRPADYKRWSGSLAECVLAVLDASYMLSNNPIATRRLSVPGSLIAEGIPYPVTFQAISLGLNLAFVAVSAEVVAEYAEHVRALSPTALTMCIGCTDHTYGYLPTRQMFAEGGYEVEEFCSFFGLTRLLPGIEDVTCASLASLFDDVDPLVSRAGSSL